MLNFQRSRPHRSRRPFAFFFDQPLLLIDSITDDSQRMENAVVAVIVIVVVKMRRSARKQVSFSLAGKRERIKYDLGKYASASCL